ncbi:MAG: hypothetical protein IPM35_37335 [Myxococcales bacterium]|nr:hypothetical protein [Myxococcales bacterium]
MRRHQWAAAMGFCFAVGLSASTSRALGPWQDYRARGIFAWVKTSSQKSCLGTPYGSIKNNCPSLAEVDVPLPYDFGKGYHTVYVSLYRAGTPKPYCQALGVGWDGTPEVVGPLVYNDYAGWHTSLPLGKIEAPTGASFVACWLNNGDALDSVDWVLSGID